MFLDKTETACASQKTFIKTTPNDENMVRPITSNFICNAKYHSSKAEPAAIWQHSQPADINHLYLKTKKVKPYGIRQRDNELIIPMYDCNNKLQNLQRILPDGKKMFLPDKPTKSCFYILGELNSSDKIYIAEGYATAASIHEATEQCTIIAFTANNLPAVAETIRWEYPDAT